MKMSITHVSDKKWATKCDSLDEEDIEEDEEEENYEEDIHYYWDGNDQIKFNSVDYISSKCIENIFSKTKHIFECKFSITTKDREKLFSIIKKIPKSKVYYSRLIPQNELFVDDVFLICSPKLSILVEPFTFNNNLNGEYFKINFQLFADERFSFDEFFLSIKDLSFAPLVSNVKHPAGYIYLLGSDQFGNPFFRHVNKPAFSPFIKENYILSVQEQYKKVVKEVTAPIPNGRIAIFQGNPGTGKTFAIRAMLQEFENIKTVLMSPDNINLLKDPGLVNLVFDEIGAGCPIIFILEDADHCLSPRKTENMSAISSILNFSDGIIGSLLDVRLICTTNTKIKDFDEAIVRPGRLIELVNIEALPYEQAQVRYNELGGDGSLPPRAYTIAEIYQLARPSKL